MEELAMKGFNTGDGYMGLVDGKYILFASESDYYEYMNDYSLIRVNFLLIMKMMQINYLMIWPTCFQRRI